jgi:hypothetical protein
VVSTIADYENKTQAGYDKALAEINAGGDLYLPREAAPC